MSITFSKDGKNYELGLDGTVKANGADFGTWSTDDRNALEITADAGGAVFRQPARWETEDNLLTVTPEDGATTEFIDATDGNLQFKLKQNRLVVDPLPDDDTFSFALTGTWALTADHTALQLTLDEDTTLSFTGGLNDSQSRFSWVFDAENDDIKKRFTLRFDGTWKMEKREGGAGVLAVFAFEYSVKDQNGNDTLTKAKFKLPVEVTADSSNGNRLLFSYQSAGSNTQWGVAFAGRFTTKGGSIIGYSAELYNDVGEISSRFTFDFKGKIKNGSVATRDALTFTLTVAGQAIEVNLSGTFNFTKSKITFAFKLNTSSRTGEVSAITFGVNAVTTDGKTADIDIKIEGGKVTINIRVGTEIKFGGSRKGSVFGSLDTTLKNDTVGVTAMFGITLN